MGSCEDRRKYKRSESQFNVRITRGRDSSHVPERTIDDARSINISAGGMYVACSGSLNVSEIVHVIFLKPHSFDLFKGYARVVRAERNNDMTCSVGLAFVGLPSSEVNDLDCQIGMLG